MRLDLAAQALLTMTDSEVGASRTPSDQISRADFAGLANRQPIRAPRRLYEPFSSPFRAALLCCSTQWGRSECRRLPGNMVTCQRVTLDHGTWTKAKATESAAGAASASAAWRVSGAMNPHSAR